MVDDRAALRLNTKLLPWLYAAMGGTFFTAVIVPFLETNGLTLRDVFLLQGIFAAVLLVAEIPTGYLADRWGRVPMAVLGASGRFAGMLVYLMSSSFSGFVVAEVLLGFGLSCQSGTLDALTYDSMAGLGETKGYRKAAGHQRFLFFGAEALCSSVGGFLAAMNIRAPLVATLLTCGAAIIVSLQLREPARHVTHKETGWKDLRRICLRVARDGRLLGIIALFSILATAGFAAFWFTQPYQTEAGLPLALFGVAHTVIVGFGAVASKWAHTLDRWLSDRIVLLITAAAIIGGLAVLGTFTSLWGIPLLILIRMGWSVLAPVTNDMTNRLVTADDRATVLSMKAFGQRLLFAIVIPLLGLITDVFTLRETILIAAGGGAVATALTLFLMHGTWRRIPQAGKTSAPAEFAPVEEII